MFAEDHGHPHVYDNWRAAVLRACLPNAYDEERRLLYVAMTRAEQHLLLSAGEEPNTFLEALPVEVADLAPDVDEREEAGTVQTTLDVSVPLPEGPVGWTPHELLSEDVFAETPEGRGAEFGTRVHEFAEAYARGEPVEPSNADEATVADFVDTLDGALHVEQDAFLPLDVDGERVTISGIVDLVAERPDAIEVYDFKTDRGRHAEAEYRKQLSVYSHVVAEAFPGRDVTASIVYTADGEVVPIEPLGREALVELVSAARDGRPGR